MPITMWFFSFFLLESAAVLSSNLEHTDAVSWLLHKYSEKQTELLPAAVRHKLSGQGAVSTCTAWQGSVLEANPYSKGSTFAFPGVLQNFLPSLCSSTHPKWAFRNLAYNTTCAPGHHKGKVALSWMSNKLAPKSPWLFQSSQEGSAALEAPNKWQQMQELRCLCCSGPLSCSRMFLVEHKLCSPAAGSLGALRVAAVWGFQDSKVQHESASPLAFSCGHWLLPQ